MFIRINEREIKLPDFLIVGAAKSGTTSLYHYLRQHPQIFMPENKEPWFFPFVDMDKKDVNTFGRDTNILNFEKYVALFKEANENQILGEASTGYLYLYEETIKSIKKYHPNWEAIKIVIIIRNPIERAFSHYLNDLAVGSIDSSFNEIIERWKSRELPKRTNYIDYGLYYNQIKAYKENFSHVKIYLFEDLKSDVKNLLQDLFIFLDADANFIPNTNIKYNISGVSKNKFINYLIFKPNLIKETVRLIVPTSMRIKVRNKMLKNTLKYLQLDKTEMDFLKNVYKEDIFGLQGLLKRDLTHWLK